MAEHLKRSGASTVVFAGDPIMPIYLTRACANIGYYPEWVITGTVLTYTSTLGRYYDQRGVVPRLRHLQPWPCPPRFSSATPTASTSGIATPTAGPPRPPE